MGTISVDGEQLEVAHQALREAVADCQRAGKRTLVLGGGHETAFGHGAGVLDAFPGEKWALLISMRIWICALPTAPAPGRRSASWRWSVTRSSAVFTIPASGLAGRRTPVRYGMKRRAAVAIVEDLEVLTAFETRVLPELERNIAQFDRLYLTIDLDVLPARNAGGVGPGGAGRAAGRLLRIVEPLCRSGKLQAVDLVEFNPLFDIDGQGARAAARVAWQIAHWWR